MTRDPNTLTPAHPTQVTPEMTGLPPADDPSGAHAKGYSADSNPHTPDVAEPIPLADAPPGGIHVPERDKGAQPTERSEPSADPNNRIASPE